MTFTTSRPSSMPSRRPFDTRDTRSPKHAPVARGWPLAQSANPDLIVLDVMLPDVDGFEVARRLRADGLATPVLFLTANDTFDDKIEGFSVGADDYVTKPFSLAEIVCASTRSSSARSAQVPTRTAG